MHRLNRNPKRAPVLNPGPAPDTLAQQPITRHSSTARIDSLSIMNSISGGSLATAAAPGSAFAAKKPTNNTAYRKKPTTSRTTAPAIKATRKRVTLILTPNE